MSDLTHVELLWLEKRIENWIRFGHAAEEQILDKRRRILSFATGSIFAFVRWASNDFGTVISRVDILRAVAPGQRCATVPYVRPGGELLLRLVRLAQGRTRVADCRRHRGARHRPRRRGAGLLAPRPQPAVRQRSASRLHALAPSGLAASSEDRAVTGRVMTLLTALLAATAVLSSIAARPVPRFLWNASESVPIGLYRLQPTDRLFVTELVAIEPPEPLATFLADGRFLPRGIPMLKRVLALPGQTVCREELRITVDKTEMGVARERDSRGRPLPVWQGCHVVADGEVFLMNWQSADSLDGRYFGALPASAIVGRAEPLWTGEEE